MGIKRKVLRNKIRSYAKRKGYRHPNKYLHETWIRGRALARKQMFVKAGGAE